jgi:hypothetical protein
LRIGKWIRRKGSEDSDYPKKKTLADKINRDTLIFYISSEVSKFSDVREATADGTARLGSICNYDIGFPISISTRLEFALDPTKWVDIHGLVEKLSFTAGKADWRQILRSSVRLLSDDDAAVILGAMKCAAKGDNVEST